ncbi:MAG: FAD-dependent oxidoreductase [Synechococcaceae cyanobacterium]|nr:FAD-dependent oxidoreductase [Synechococcaceae cyanobacterium]
MPRHSPSLRRIGASFANQQAREGCHRRRWVELLDTGVVAAAKGDGQGEPSPKEQRTDVLIVGGGVCGAALLFELARYTDLAHLTLVERYGRLAAVNSCVTNNSQTIHVGDIETNYTLEKALTVKRTAEMISHYGELLDSQQRDRCIFRTPKMVLAVGEQECQALRRRFELFAPHFPAMELLEKEQIAAWEPEVALVDGELRPEPLLAIGIRNSDTAVDYGALTESFVDQARAALAATPERQLDLRLNTAVTRITPEGATFLVELEPGPDQPGLKAATDPTATTTPDPGANHAGPDSSTEAAAAGPRRLRARHVVVCAGAHSLLLAQRMGFGLEYSCLPVAGSFYFTPDLLRGKVYTMQNDKLPFAAIHGDPDVRSAGLTRFGPTALLLPRLERYNGASFWEFLEVLRLDWDVLMVFVQLFAVADIRNYILRNLLFEVPGLRRRLFLADARKIVPGLQLEQLRFAEGYGGVRPQLIDRKQRKLMLGEVRIEALPGLSFNVTPSPGGTCCLGNAARDVETIAARLGCRFDRERLERELVRAPLPVS